MFYDYDDKSAENEEHMIPYFTRKVEKYELRRQGVRIVRRLPDLQQIARADRLQPGGPEGQQQRGTPPGQRRTLLRLLQYGDVEPIELSHLIDIMAGWFEYGVS